MNINNENKLQELSLYVNINLNNMNIQKQQNAKTYNKDNNSLNNINKIKREVNAIIKRQRFTARRCKRASEEEILDLEINKYEEVESINKKKIPSKIYEFSNGDIYIGKW